MIELVTKFISWVKEVFSLIISIPSKLSALSSFAGTTLGFLPNGLGSIIAGLLIICVTFVMIYAIVKLVTNLL